MEALDALADQGITSAIPEIIPLLSSPDDSVRAASVEALDQLTPGKNWELIEQALLPLLNDEEGFVRSRAAEAIGPFAYPPALESLKRLLHHDGDWVVRASAAEALGNYYGDESLLPHLERALDDTEEIVQAYAAYSLGLLASPAYLPKLQVYLATKDSPRVKRELLIASYRLGAPGSLRQLINLIETTNEEKEALRLLNAILPLTERKVPPFLRADASQLRAALISLNKRLPAWGVEVKQILENLAQLV